MTYENLKSKIDEGQTGIREVFEFLTDLVNTTPELKSSLAEFNMLKRRATFAKTDEDWFNLGENLKVFMLKGEVKKRLA